MRYRPFNAAGLSISAVTLDLPPGLSERAARDLIGAAVGCGVNAFCVAADEVSSLTALRDVVVEVGRGLLVLIVRLEPGTAMGPAVAQALRTCGGTLFDAALAEPQDPSDLAEDLLAELEALRRSGQVRRLALAARTEELGTACMDAFAFDVLAFRFNVESGWPERNLLRKAASRGMTVLGIDPHPAALGGGGGAEGGRRGLARFLPAKRTPASEGPYGFLERTATWTPEQITLAFALTEPRLASVLVRTDRVDLLEALAEVPDRELPPAVAAQIEMARFSGPASRRVG